MKRIWRSIGWPLVGLTVLLAFAFGNASTSVASAPGQKASKPVKYVGAAKCKSCHSKKQTGHQFGIWTTSKHAAAFVTLESEEAKEFRAARGVDDPVQSDECLRCHVTGHGEPKERFARSFDAKLGIQCESCHGPGDRHVRARLLAADDEDEEEDPFAGEAGPAVLPPGEIISVPKPESCLQCHNDESPAYVPFCFHETMKVIRHLNPKKPRTKAELAALDICACKETCVCRKDSPDKTCRTAGAAKGE